MSSSPLFAGVDIGSTTFKLALVDPANGSAACEFAVRLGATYVHERVG